MKESEELIIVTGATGGLGKCISSFFKEEALANPHLHPVFCCRDEVKGRMLCKQLQSEGLPESRYTLLVADFSSLQNVEKLIDDIIALNIPIRWLVNNAAAMFVNFGQTAEGIENTMAVNFLSPAIISKKLLPHLIPSGSLVNILSVSRNFFPLKPGFLKGEAHGYFRLRTYSCSKLALSIFTALIAERYPHLYINGVDPGVMNTAMLKMNKWIDPFTDIFFRPFTRKPSQSLPAVIRACQNKDQL